jgi:predicted RNA binding protein YcfA (HicA-like mRNA interferase family)
MPLKIRDLVRALEQAGFVNRSGKGSHRKFVHPKVAKPVVISGRTGDDALYYQEKSVKAALEEAQR